MHPQDFGNYSCNAENQLGKSKKYLMLSGKPNTAIFRSSPVSQYKDRFVAIVFTARLRLFSNLSFSNPFRYNISWTVDSHSPIEEYKLFFRRSSEEHELDNNIEQQSQAQHQTHSHSNSLYSNNYRNNYGNPHWSRNDWRDVVLPAMPLSHLYTQSMSYLIRGLDPDQQYEAKVQAK